MRRLRLRWDINNDEGQMSTTNARQQQQHQYNENTGGMINKKEVKGYGGLRLSDCNQVMEKNRYWDMGRDKRGRGGEWRYGNVNK